jgi:alcohol dehydrogenase
MQKLKEQAREIIRDFKGGNYIFGAGCFDQLGPLAAGAGGKTAVAASGFEKDWGSDLHEKIRNGLEETEGVTLAGTFIRGARPNAPREDVFRIAEEIREQDPDCVIAAGGGSTIDAVKAALAWNALRDVCPDFDTYFGAGQLSAKLAEHGRALLPLVAVQTASGSAAHLTKYSNVTRLDEAQKMLIADEAVVPGRALFDYGLTVSAPRNLTLDGGLDGVAHCLEVLYGLPQEEMETTGRDALLGMELIIRHLKTACEEPGDLDAREALGLGTDLGGCAIMRGGTSGAHLTSFSLVDILSHGRACAILNPYYTVFFAEAIEAKLRPVGKIYQRAGYNCNANLEELHGRELGEAVARAMLAHARDTGFPATLAETGDFSTDHLKRALAAAKDPRLEMKLRNMPVPLEAADVEKYMRPVLEAARCGDFRLIRSPQ